MSVSRFLGGTKLGKYRGRLQIIADILGIIGNGSKKTRIMYRANLSYKLLCRYLAEVLNAGLVKCKEKDSYVLTPKGDEFLSKYEDYSKRCKGLAEHLHSVNSQKATLEGMCLKPTFRGNSSGKKRTKQ